MADRNRRDVTATPDRQRQANVKLNMKGCVVHCHRSCPDDLVSQANLEKWELTYNGDA